MPSTRRRYALTAVRILLAGGGLVVAIATIHALATLSPPPPGSDGFVTGMAFLGGSVLVVLAAGAASLGVVLPTVLGAADPLGFGRGQRRLLKGAAGTAGGGFLLGLAVGLASELQYGLILWLGLLLLATLVVCLAVAWRAAEAAVGGVRRLLRSAT